MSATRHGVGRVARCIALVIVLVTAACTTFERPPPLDQAALRAQAVTATQNGIRASVALPTAEQSRAIFGIDLAERDIQPVWLEIENLSAPRFVFLPTGVDPEYFSPFEVTFAYHEAFADEANAQLDDHLRQLNFDGRGLLVTGTTRSGFIYAAHPRPTRAIDVDLIGDQWSQTLTVIVSTPEGTLAADLERQLASLDESELLRTEDDDQLRAALEVLPCCTATAAGEIDGLPLNLVLVGTPQEWATGMVRRGYRSARVEKRYVFSRAHAIAVRKQAEWVAAQPLQLRLWLTAIRHQGSPVWVGQVANLLGGRLDPATAGRRRPNPDLDEARNDLVQDLIYSQAMARLGFVGGAGAPGVGEYRGDGLRAVMTFERRPVSLAELQFFDWERLSDPDQPRPIAVGAPWRERLEPAPTP